MDSFRVLSDREFLVNRNHHRIKTNEKPGTFPNVVDRLVCGVKGNKLKYCLAKESIAVVCCRECKALETNKYQSNCS